MDTIYLSWSRLRTHEECKQKGFLQRAGKKAGIDNHRNFLPGNITDRVVRDWLLDDPHNSKGLMKDMVVDYMEKSLKDTEKQKGVIIWKSPNDKNEIITDCIQAVTEIEPFLEKYVVPFEYTPDFSFKAPVDIKIEGREDPVQVILNGYMDIFVKHSEDNFFIFDVKHTKDNYYWKKTFGQLAFYDTATKLLTGEYSKYSALLQPLCKEKVKPFHLTDLDRQSMWQSISNFTRDIVNNDNEPTTEVSQCSMCNVKHACSRFQPKMINGRKVFSL